MEVGSEELSFYIPNTISFPPKSSQVRACGCNLMILMEAFFSENRRHQSGSQSRPVQRDTNSSGTARQTPSNSPIWSPLDLLFVFAETVGLVKGFLILHLNHVVELGTLNKLLVSGRVTDALGCRRISRGSR